MRHLVISKNQIRDYCAAVFEYSSQYLAKVRISKLKTIPNSDVPDVLPVETMTDEEGTLYLGQLNLAEHNLLSCTAA
jgi:hypothetical protein